MLYIRVQNVCPGWKTAGNQGNHQNFDPPLLTNKLCLVFMKMKQKKKFKMADSKVPKSDYVHATWLVLILTIYSSTLLTSILNNAQFVSVLEWVNAVERLRDCCQWRPLSNCEWSSLVRISQPFYSLLIANLIYCRHTIITAVCIFYPIFHWGLYCRVVYKTERLILSDSFFII